MGKQLGSQTILLNCYPYTSPILGEISKMRELPKISKYFFLNPNLKFMVNCLCLVKI